MDRHASLWKQAGYASLRVVLWALIGSVVFQGCIGIVHSYEPWSVLVMSNGQSSSSPSTTSDPANLTAASGNGSQTSSANSTGGTYLRLSEKNAHRASWATLWLLNSVVSSSVGVFWLWSIWTPPFVVRLYGLLSRALTWNGGQAGRWRSRTDMVEPVPMVQRKASTVKRRDDPSPPATVELPLDSDHPHRRPEASVSSSSPGVSRWHNRLLNLWLFVWAFYFLVFQTGLFVAVLPYISTSPFAPEFEIVNEEVVFIDQDPALCMDMFDYSAFIGGNRSLAVPRLQANGSSVGGNGTASAGAGPQRLCLDAVGAAFFGVWFNAQFFIFGISALLHPAFGQHGTAKPNKPSADDSTNDHEGPDGAITSKRKPIPWFLIVTIPTFYLIMFTTIIVDWVSTSTVMAATTMSLLTEKVGLDVVYTAEYVTEALDVQSMQHLMLLALTACMLLWWLGAATWLYHTDLKQVARSKTWVGIAMLWLVMIFSLIDAVLPQNLASLSAELKSQVPIAATLVLFFYTLFANLCFGSAMRVCSRLWLAHHERQQEQQQEEKRIRQSQSLKDLTPNLAGPAPPQFQILNVSRWLYTFVRNYVLMCLTLCSWWATAMIAYNPPISIWEIKSTWIDWSLFLASSVISGALQQVGFIGFLFDLMSVGFVRLKNLILRLVRGRDYRVSGPTPSEATESTVSTTENGGENLDANNARDIEQSSPSPTFMPLSAKGGDQDTTLSVSSVKLKRNALMASQQLLAKESEEITVTITAESLSQHLLLANLLATLMLFICGIATPLLWPYSPTINSLMLNTAMRNEYSSLVWPTALAYGLAVLLAALRIPLWHWLERHNVIAMALWIEAKGDGSAGGVASEEELRKNLFRAHLRRIKKLWWSRKHPDSSSVDENSPDAGHDATIGEAAGESKTTYVQFAHESAVEFCYLVNRISFTGWALVCAFSMVGLATAGHMGLLARLMKDPKAVAPSST